MKEEPVLDSCHGHPPFHVLPPLLPSVGGGREHVLHGELRVDLEVEEVPQGTDRVRTQRSSPLFRGASAAGAVFSFAGERTTL